MPVVGGDGRAPTVHALGEQVVGALLLDDAVGDRELLAGGVLAAQQPAAAADAQRGPDEASERAFAVVAGRLGHRVRRHHEGIGRRREKAQRQVVAAGGQVRREGVDRRRDADVRGAVGIHVVAEHEPALEPVDPPPDGPEVVQQVGSRALGQPRVARLGVGGRYDEPPGALAGRRQDAAPQVRAGQVDPDDLAAPAQDRPQRAHLGAGPEHDDALVAQVEPLGVVQDTLDRLLHARLHDAVAHPLVQAPA